MARRPTKRRDLKQWRVYNSTGEPMYRLLDHKEGTVEYHFTMEPKEWMERGKQVGVDVSLAKLTKKGATDFLKPNYYMRNVKTNKVIAFKDRVRYGEFDTGRGPRYQTTEGWYTPKGKKKSPDGLVGGHIHDIKFQGWASDPRTDKVKGLGDIDIKQPTTYVAQQKYMERYAPKAQDRPFKRFKK